MSVSILFWLLVALTIGVWGCALIGFWYGQKLLAQQQKDFKCLVPYLKKIIADQETLKSLTISDDIPLAKLEKIDLPENVRLNFSHKKIKD